MQTFTNTVRFTVATALLVPGLAWMWASTVPDTLTPLSYAIFAGLLTALAAVALITYKNAQATVSVAHLLRDADTTGSATTHDIRRAASRHRPLA